MIILHILHYPASKLQLKEKKKIMQKKMYFGLALFG